jgi:hypothetical protein
MPKFGEHPTNSNSVPQLSLEKKKLSETKEWQMAPTILPL